MHYKKFFLPLRVPHSFPEITSGNTRSTFGTYKSRSVAGGQTKTLNSLSEVLEFFNIIMDLSFVGANSKIYFK